MPHLHIKEFKEVPFASSCDGVEFGFIANNINNKEEKLISTKIEGNDFFLLVKEEDNRVLLKTDKLTRPTSTHLSHNALLAYAKAANLEVLSSNVVENSKNIHLNEMSWLKNIEFFASDFKENREIRVEIGFGSGRHLLHQAQNNPNVLFIGIEIHKPSIEQVLKQINIQNIKNIYILEYDARLFMELLPSNSVGKIFVHFPVPWDKKPHRRVISAAFVNEAKRVLMAQGTLELRTDSDNYYNYSYETMMALNRVTLNINKNRDIAVSSKYEDRWKKMQKNIYDLTMINDEISQSLNFNDKFTEIKVLLSDNAVKKLYKFVDRFEDGFINFERVYELVDGVMVRLAMGSYERPEHVYLIIRDGIARYFPFLPLKSRTNLEAHKHLSRILNG